MQLAILLSCAVIGLLSTSPSGQTTTNSVAVRAFVKQDCDGVKTYICDTCTSRRPCIGTTEIAQSINCATGLYCVEGTSSDRCGPIASDVCLQSTVSTSFTCTSTGILPDPNNCNNYHVCLAVGEASSVYNCAPGYVFNIASAGCIREVSTTNCVTVTCPAGEPTYVLYGTSRQYYVICDGTNPPTHILKCPNQALFSFFSGSTRFGECVYTCSGQGNYANSNNPSSYFQCYVLNGRIVYREVDCPQNTIFNQTLRYCVRAQ
ncbi:uncharacterized protein LOC125956174 [Anopheles darlingi]|uniref:uncharacterized protein LOC125956174 n=1 Tax=Anopheles darlingi TaxID=43151 RepID=UPI002100341D|nr:uncharacterized protein LOC125956174 [Anopheles darlingi]